MVSLTVLVLCLIAAAGLVWLLSKMHFGKVQAELRSELKLAQNQQTDLKAAAAKLETELKQQQERERLDLEKKNQETAELIRAKAALETKLQEQTKSLAEKLDILNNAKDQMKLEFETLAQKILEEKGSKFSEQSKEQLGNLLNPYKTELENFNKLVKETYTQESTDRISLREQIKLMDGAYKTLSKDAENLVKALKSDTKTQGDWGEINLRRILDFAGLKEGVNYFFQHGFKTLEGESLRPDIVINLPDDKQIVVDSKVSLTGYERYCKATDDVERSAAVKDHKISVRKHVQELSEKNYEDLIGINTLDFVLMFIPVEPAFFVALENDSDLYQYASEKRVLIVCPSTLLITMHLVVSLWRAEQQKRNVAQIAEVGGRMYDKFLGFVESLTEIRKHLNKSIEAYDKAWKKLDEGKGNLISQALKMKILGVKTKSKLSLEALSSQDLAEALENSEIQPDEAEADIEVQPAEQPS